MIASSGQLESGSAVGANVVGDRVGNAVGTSVATVGEIVGVNVVGDAVRRVGPRVGEDVGELVGHYRMGIRTVSKSSLPTDNNCTRVQTYIATVTWSGRVEERNSKPQAIRNES